MKAENTRAELEASADAWQRTIDFWETGRVHLSAQDAFLFLGCGSSFHVARLAAQALRDTAKAAAAAARCSDVMLSPERFRPKGGPSLAVIVSRSGQTSEDLEAAKAVAALGYDTLALTCSEEGELLQWCRQAVVLSFIREKSLVATSSVSSFALLFFLMAAGLSKDEGLARQLRNLPARAAAFLSSSSRLEAEEFVAKNRTQSAEKEDSLGYMVFLGLDNCLTVAWESALKLKEMALVPCDAQQALEFRHGPKALVEEGSLVGLFRAEEFGEAELKVLEEAGDLGADTLLICARPTPQAARAASVVCAVGGEACSLARIPLYLLAGQGFGLAKALARGIDPDQPRHLGYFVTVKESSA
jgi:glucosamine--fructose-6-phosphate aminotransferase (isomerizing)